MNTFAERLEELIRTAGGASKLSAAAGLSPNYIATLKTRMRANASARPDDKALEELARAGGVSYEWLKRGAAAKTRAADDSIGRPPSSDAEPFADALAAAFEGRRHSLADLDAARAVARETHTHLREGADTQAIAATWLDAAAALRRSGKEATPSAILMHLSDLATSRAAEVEAAASADVDASLRAKGIEPGDPEKVQNLRRKRT